MLLSQICLKRTSVILYHFGHIVKHTHSSVRWTTFRVNTFTNVIPSCRLALLPSGAHVHCMNTCRSCVASSPCIHRGNASMLEVLLSFSFYGQKELSLSILLLHQ